MKTFAKFIIITMFVSIASSQNLVSNPGFELTESTSDNWPTTLSDWSGDYSEIVASTGEVTPYEGSNMLQFKGAYDNGAGIKNASEIFQIIAIDNYRSQIELGDSILKASVYFNRVNIDSQTDTEFRLRIGAFAGTPEMFPTLQNTSNFLAESGYLSFFSDSNIQTWEKFECQINVPVNTDYVFVMIASAEDIYNDYSSPEFDGHFADAVSVEIVPEPATILLFGIGFIGLKTKKVFYSNKD